MFPWRKMHMAKAICQLNASFQVCADKYPEHESNEGRSGDCGRHGCRGKSSSSGRP
jgi:hypothetical protein